MGCLSLNCFIRVKSVLKKVLLTHTHVPVRAGASPISGEPEALHPNELDGVEQHITGSGVPQQA